MYQKYDQDNKLIESREITIEEKESIESWMNTENNKKLLLAFLEKKPLPDVKIKWSE